MKRKQQNEVRDAYDLPQTLALLLKSKRNKLQNPSQYLLRKTCGQKIDRNLRGMQNLT